MGLRASRGRGWVRAAGARGFRQLHAGGPARPGAARAGGRKHLGPGGATARDGRVRPEARAGPGRGGGGGRDGQRAAPGRAWRSPPARRPWAGRRGRSGRAAPRSLRSTRDPRSHSAPALAPARVQTGPRPCDDRHGPPSPSLAHPPRRAGRHRARNGGASAPRRTRRTPPRPRARRGAGSGTSRPAAEAGRQARSGHTGAGTAAMPATSGSYIPRRASVMAGPAFSGVPASKGGAGSYSTLSWRPRA